MHAWLCENPVGPEALSWQQLPAPEMAPGDVRIAISAASLNFPDLLIVQNKYQFRPPLPFVPGAEFAGVIEAMGSEVRNLRVGQRVAAFAGTGGFATQACVAAAMVLPLPEELPLDVASAFILTYGTAHHALLDRAALKPGETVLVLGAAGGVGTAAIQIAKAVGARVIAAASSAAKCDLCLRIGADAAIDYSRENMRDCLKALTAGQGPDVVVDPVGGDLAEAVLRSIAWRGRYLVVGFARGHIPTLPFNLVLLKSACVSGVFWGEHVRREPQANASAMAELLRWQQQGRIDPVIDERIPMRELPRAFARMSARQVQGKLVLVND